MGAHELAEQLRRELEWIPLKAIRKSRDERYKSADRLAEDVQNYLAGRPLMAGPPSLAYEARKWVGRHKGVVLAAAVVLMVAGVFGGLLARQYAETVQFRDIALLQRESAELNAYEANIAASAGLLDRNQVSEARRRLTLPAETAWLGVAAPVVVERRERGAAALNAPVTAFRITPTGRVSR